MKLFFVSLFLIISTAAARPNLVVFIADDQGWGDLSFNGNTNIDTPRIDSLAREGLSFDRFFVCPVCSPTRAEYLTGRYHSRTGVTGVSRGNERLNLDEQTIGDVFRSSGYATGLFGKWHNGMQAPYHPNSRGFEEFYGFCSGHWGNYFDPMLEQNGAIVKGSGYLTDDITSKAIEFMEANAGVAKPFFVTIALNTPHSPMQVPDRYWEKFEDKDLAMRHREENKEDPMFTKAALAMCENIDWNVGRILDTLDDLGIDKETIVVYFSDNGPNSHRWNGDMKGRKGQLDEGGVRSPLFIRWPEKIAAGASMRSISSVTDLLPTFADLCDIDLNPVKKRDGRNLTPFIRNGIESSENRYIFSHHDGRFSLRDQRYRIDNDGQLFDLQDDPGQRRNIAATHPDIHERMHAELDRLKNDIMPSAVAERPFTFADPHAIWTQLPARDAIAGGGIQRSNRYPNCSYFHSWTSTEDSISWNAEALSDGRFEAIVYYACPEEDIGSTIELSFRGKSVRAEVDSPHNPPLIGAANDRIERGESYVKDWAKMSLGEIEIRKGRGPLELRAINVSGNQAMEFRLLMLRRIEP